MPYTYNTTNKQVIIESLDNRRYTMRDIGKLESRIGQLEEFTKLSMLERATASTQILDNPFETVDPDHSPMYTLHRTFAFSVFDPSFQKRYQKVFLYFLPLVPFSSDKQ
jgi:hypothetical protein